MHLYGTQESNSRAGVTVLHATKVAPNIPLTIFGINPLIDEASVVMGLLAESTGRFGCHLEE